MSSVTASELLPTDDPFLRAAELDLAMLTVHWAAYGARRPMTAEQMRGADVRAQRLGVAGVELMEQAGAAVAAAARALIATTERPADSVVLVLCGPGNNGGDGFVAARLLAGAGIRCAVALVSHDEEPGTADALANWRRLDETPDVERIQAASSRDVGVLGNGLEKAGLVIDALLGTGVRGSLRTPVGEAVDLVNRARRLGVPILSVDTPTAVDLTSGAASDPAVRAHVTVTFHRPKEGLRLRPGSLLAGRVLVAPIGIPSAADPA
jgi:NAD(P)H-hydrate epimerase